MVNILHFTTADGESICQNATEIKHNPGEKERIEQAIKGEQKSTQLDLNYTMQHGKPETD